MLGSRQVSGARSRQFGPSYLNLRLSARVPSPMDHNAIICSMTDGLARGPDKDVHGPGVGSQKYPSRGADVKYLTYRWGSMGSDETATATTGGPRVIGVLRGAGAIGSSTCLFSVADRPSDAAPG